MEAEANEITSISSMDPKYDPELYTDEIRRLSESGDSEAIFNRLRELHKSNCEFMKINDGHGIIIDNQNSVLQDFQNKAIQVGEEYGKLVAEYNKVRGLYFAEVEKVGRLKTEFLRMQKNRVPSPNGITVLPKGSL